VTEQIESDVPQRHDIFGGMVLPDTAAVCIARDIQRPMELVLNVPMLADHGGAGGSRSYQTGKGEAVVTGDRRVLVRPPNRFHDHDRLEAWPLCPRRQGLHICHCPNSSTHATSVGVVKRIKAMVRMAPRQVMFDVLMQVLVDLRGGLCMVPFQGSKIVAALVLHLARNGRLTAHGVDGHDTALDRQQLEEVGNGRDRIGLILGLSLAHDEPPMIRTPGGKPRQRIHHHTLFFC
jgi:hypothetical protein